MSWGLETLQALGRALQHAEGHLAHEHGGGLEVDALVLEAHQHGPERVVLRLLGARERLEALVVQERLVEGVPAPPNKSMNRKGGKGQEKYLPESYLLCS